MINGLFDNLLDQSLMSAFHSRLSYDLGHECYTADVTIKCWEFLDLLLFLFGFLYLLPGCGLWAGELPPKDDSLQLYTRTPQDSYTHDLLWLPTLSFSPVGFRLWASPSLGPRDRPYICHLLYANAFEAWKLYAKNCVILMIKMVLLQNRRENQHQWIFGILKDAFNRYSSWQIFYGVGYLESRWCNWPY